MEQVGCQVTDLRVTGGLARLPLWCQARADITGKKVLLPEQEESDLVGNACVGFYGLEEFDSPADAAENLVRFQKIYHPNAGAREVYDELFAVFTKACAELEGTFQRLTEKSSPVRGDRLRGAGAPPPGSQARGCGVMLITCAGDSRSGSVSRMCTSLPSWNHAVYPMEPRTRRPAYGRSRSEGRTMVRPAGVPSRMA